MESILPVHVYMEDTDCGGVVYHANFVKYFERGRSDWIYRIGYGLDRLAQEGIFFVVRNVNVDYLAPARLHDNLLVVSKVATVKRTSIIFEQYLYRDDAEKKLLAKALVTVVCVDRHVKATALPEKLREILQ